MKWIIPSLKLSKQGKICTFPVDSQQKRARIDLFHLSEHVSGVKTCKYKLPKHPNSDKFYKIQWFIKKTQKIARK